MRRLTVSDGRIVVGALGWTSASAGSLTASATIVALAWMGASLPDIDLITLTLTNLVAVALFWVMWPLRPQFAWDISQWLLFSTVSLVLILAIYGVGLPWYVHLLHTIA
ncbi:MAG: hypothetical protein M1600_02110 [Firmicutes bacterium]|jgi:hypothetical protein|nr:hypothetical protein [Bacillota bacterium]